MSDTATGWIVFWKETPGQHVSTVVDAHNQPVIRDGQYLREQGIRVINSEKVVFRALKEADGEKYGITPELARRTLGWDL